MCKQGITTEDANISPWLQLIGNHSNSEILIVNFVLCNSLLVCIRFGEMKLTKIFCMIIFGHFQISEKIKSTHLWLCINVYYVHVVSIGNPFSIFDTDWTCWMICPQVEICTIHSFCPIVWCIFNWTQSLRTFQYILILSTVWDKFIKRRIVCYVINNNVFDLFNVS